MRKARLNFPLAAVAALLALGCRGGNSTRTAPPPQPRGSNASPLYKDVAADAGIDFTWGHGKEELLDIQQTIGHGCAFIDYDQDGNLDVLLVGNDRCALYRNLGSGRFSDVSSDSGLDARGKLGGVAAGDYDNDGYPDVCITGYGCCRLYHNRGGQAGKPFENVTAASGVRERGPYDFVSVAAFADLDGDGRLDLIAGRYIKFTPQSQRFCKFGEILAGCRVSLYDPDHPVVYRNEGGGKFSDATKSWGFDVLDGRCLGLAIRAGDDGKSPVVYFADDEMPCDLMVRRGGKYVNIGTESGTAFGRQRMRQAGMGCDWGDFDGDGKPDLIVATFVSEPKSLYRCDSPDTYSDVSSAVGLSFNTSPYLAWTAAFVDYDNDGWPDLFFTNGHVQSNIEKLDPTQSYPQPMQLFHNDAGKRFTSMGAAAGPPFGARMVGHGATIGDFDNDGRPDLLVVNEEGRAMLLHNETRSTNHWIGIQLVGKRCNRDAIGARVRVMAGGRTLVRDEQLCGGYFSARDPRLQFGLGSAAAVDRIEIAWPDGRVQRIERGDPRLGIDRYATIEEPGDK